MQVEHPGAGIQTNHRNGAGKSATAISISGAHRHSTSDLFVERRPVQYERPGLLVAIWTMSSNAAFPWLWKREPTNYAGMYRNWYKTNLRYGSFGAEVAGLQYSQLNNDCARCADVADSKSQNSNDAVQTLRWATHLPRRNLAEMEETAPVDAHRHYIQGDVSGTAGVIRAG